MKSIEHGAKRKAEEVEPLQRKKERRELKPAKKKYCMIWIIITPWKWLRWKKIHQESLLEKMSHGANLEGRTLGKRREECLIVPNSRITVLSRIQSFLGICHGLVPRPLQIPKSVDAQVPYIKWWRTVSHWNWHLYPWPPTCSLEPGFLRTKGILNLQSANLDWLRSSQPPLHSPPPPFNLSRQQHYHFHKWQNPQSSKM